MQFSPCIGLPRRIFLATLLLPALLFTGCGHTVGEFVTTTPPPVQPPPPPVAKARFGYVANYGGSSISMYKISTTGAWTPDVPATIPTGVGPESLAVDPLGKFVYAANLHDGTVSMYSIDQTTGLLTALSPATIPCGQIPQDIAINPSGTFAYTANTASGDMTVYSINRTTGQLTLVTTIPIVNPLSQGGFSDPVTVSIHPSGKFLYVTNGSYEQAYRIDQTTGVPTFLPPATFSQVEAGSHPFKLAFDPTGKFGYVPDNGSNNVYEFSIDTGTGQLSPLSPGVAVSGNQPAWVAVGTLYPYAYVSNRLGNTITSFAADPGTGQLTVAASTSGVNAPWPMLFDPSGQILYVLDEGNEQITSFATHANGSLTQITTYPAGFVPASFGVTQ